MNASLIIRITILLDQGNDNIPLTQYLKLEFFYKYHKHQQMYMWHMKHHKQCKCCRFITCLQVISKIIKLVLIFHISNIIPVSRTALAFDISWIKELSSCAIVAFDLWVLTILTSSALHGEIINNLAIWDRIVSFIEQKNVNGGI